MSTVVQLQTATSVLISTAIKDETETVRNTVTAQVTDLETQVQTVEKTATQTATATVRYSFVGFLPFQDLISFIGYNYRRPAGCRD